MPVIAGAGSNSTAEAIELARHAKKAGADAVLVVTGYYNKPTQEGIYRHFKAIADAVGIPIFVYNIPRPRGDRHLGRDDGSGCPSFRTSSGCKDATAKLTRVSLQRAGLRQGLHPALGRGRDRARLQRPWRAGLHFGDRERGAAALRRVPGRLPGRRLQGRARHPGPADAAARGAVRRHQPGADQVRAFAAGPVLGDTCGCRSGRCTDASKRVVREAMVHAGLINA